MEKQHRNIFCGNGCEYHLRVAEKEKLKTLKDDQWFAESVLLHKRHSHTHLQVPAGWPKPLMRSYEALRPVSLSEHCPLCSCLTVCRRGNQTAS